MSLVAPHLTFIFGHNVAVASGEPVTLPEVDSPGFTKVRRSKIDLEASRMWLQKAAMGGDVYSQRALGWEEEEEEEQG